MKLFLLSALPSIIYISIMITAALIVTMAVVSHAVERVLRGRTLDELIAEQRRPIITDLEALAADFWPEDESADDINAYIEQQRRADRELP